MELKASARNPKIAFPRIKVQGRRPPTTPAIARYPRIGWSATLSILLVRVSLSDRTFWAL
jgi:hypothetical protein